MIRESFMALIGPVGLRVLISQHYGLRPYEAFFYNSVDMMVSAFAYVFFKERKKDHSATQVETIGYLLGARAVGILTGVMVLRLNPWRTIDIPIAVCLNFASLCANFLLNAISRPSSPPTYQESTPTAPPPDKWENPLLSTYF
jgi:hypothetical protein